MSGLSRVQRASVLARKRAARGLVPFADANERLQRLKQQHQEAGLPVLVMAEDSHALLSTPGGEFVFRRTDGGLDPFRSEPSRRIRSPYAEIWLVPETERQKGRFVGLRALAGSHVGHLTNLAFIAHASTMMDFRVFSKYCSRCGSVRNENETACPGCKLERYPRQSPCAIVLVHDPHIDSVLLGRRTGGNVWSLLAGFCEPLECIEHCAVREVKEESNVTIARESVEIVATQPWPFGTRKYEGTSLMMGCYAETETLSQVPKACVNELEEVKWFETGELRRLCEKDSEILPFRASMARFLMQAFIDSERPSLA